MKNVIARLTAEQANNRIKQFQLTPPPPPSKKWVFAPFIVTRITVGGAHWIQLTGIWILEVESNGMPTTIIGVFVNFNITQSRVTLT